MDAVDICPVVLAGGSGTRLWPLSREGFPKQLLKLAGDSTLLQETIARMTDTRFDSKRFNTVLRPPVVVCHEGQRDLTMEQLDALGGAVGKVLLEPVSRNTAPALTVASLYLTREGADPVVVAVPADHVISERQAFRKAVLAAVDFARNGMVMTLGVVPTRADPQFGYVRKGTGIRAPGGGKGYSIGAFVEKPGRDAAASYVASEQYFWNSGIFVMRASIWLDAIDRHRPAILEACKKAVDDMTLEGDVLAHLSDTAFRACPSDSIDYAVMERLAHSYVRPADDGRQSEGIPAGVVPLEAGWADIGSWQAILDQHQATGEDNVLEGDVFSYATSGSLVLSKDRLVAAMGLTDTVVVETPDAVLVAHKDLSHEVPLVVEWLRESARDEVKHHRQVPRPWGHYEKLTVGDNFTVHRLSLKPYAVYTPSAKADAVKHWVIVRGSAKVTRGDEELNVLKDESVLIPGDISHRLENLEAGVLEVIEIQSSVQSD